MLVSSGDVYETVTTPAGLRFISGDVEGKVCQSRPVLGPAQHPPGLTEVHACGGSAWSWPAGQCQEQRDDGGRTA